MGEFNTFLFDNSIEGLFSLIFRLYSEKNFKSRIYSTDDYVPSLCDTFTVVETNYEHYLRVKKGILSRVGYRTLVDIRYCLASNDKEKCNIIFNFLILLFKENQKVLSMLSCPSVVLFNETVKRVQNECHRMKGFLRFINTKRDIYYSKITPDNDITQFLLPHFINRFNNMSFVIHDTAHQKIGMYDSETKQFVVSPFAKELILTLSKDELKFSELWKTYYKSINIESRKNKKLQDCHLPRRYKKNMTEFFT